MQVGVHPQAAPLTPLQRQQQPVNLARDIYGQGSVGKEGFLWVTVWRGSVWGGQHIRQQQRASASQHGTLEIVAWPSPSSSTVPEQAERHRVSGVYTVALSSPILQD